MEYSTVFCKTPPKFFMTGEQFSSIMKQRGRSTMWGNVKGAPSVVLHTHVWLSDRLASHAWNRVQVWKSAASVHSWKFGGREFAFDVVPTESRTTVTLVSRDKSIAPVTKVGLEREGVGFRQIEGRPERLLISSFSHEGQLPPVDDIAHAIEETRKAVELSVIDSFCWTDAQTDIDITYSVKNERKSSPEIVFLFSSIRTKPHWLDFGGPEGKSL